MIKEVIINNFRIFKDITFKIGKRITVIAGTNATGKSTILGMLGNSCELKSKSVKPIIHTQFRTEFSEIFKGSKEFDKSSSNLFKIVFLDDKTGDEDFRNFRITWQNEDSIEKMPKELRIEDVNDWNLLINKILQPKDETGAFIKELISKRLLSQIKNIKNELNEKDKQKLISELNKICKGNPLFTRLSEKQTPITNKRIEMLGKIKHKKEEIVRINVAIIQEIFSKAIDKSGSRFRVLCVGEEKNGEKVKIHNRKKEWPSLYLGLLRLFPIGESNSDPTNAPKLTLKAYEEEWFSQNYQHILTIYQTINDIKTSQIGETERKKWIGVSTESYDHITNSAGQDNIGQILCAVLSFQRLQGSFLIDIDDIINWDSFLNLIFQKENPVTKKIYDIIGEKIDNQIINRLKSGKIQIKLNEKKSFLEAINKIIKNRKFIDSDLRNFAVNQTNYKDELTRLLIPDINKLRDQEIQKLNRLLIEPALNGSLKKVDLDHGKDYSGGLLLIDELEATLHPSAQMKLFDFLYKTSIDLNLQIVFTTHSSDLLKYIYSKKENTKDQINPIEIIFLSKANEKANGDGNLVSERNPEFMSIFNDLHLTNSYKNKRKIDVYVEDDEAKWFLENILEHSNKVTITSVKLGSNNIIKLFNTGRIYFENTIFILDGDQPIDKIRKETRIGTYQPTNLLVLPGGKSPEKVIYDYVIELPEDHIYLTSQKEISRSYFISGLENLRYEEEERKKFKKWFSEEKNGIEQTDLLNFWKEDNQQEVEQFNKKFVEEFNKIAARIFIPPIRNRQDV